MSNSLKERAEKIFKGFDDASSPFEVLDNLEDKDAAIKAITQFIKATEDLKLFLESLSDEEYKQLSGLSFA
jgi:hypothetical protein